MMIDNFNKLCKNGNVNEILKCIENNTLSIYDWNQGLCGACYGGQLSKNMLLCGTHITICYQVSLAWGLTSTMPSLSTQAAMTWYCIFYTNHPIVTVP